MGGLLTKTKIFSSLNQNMSEVAATLKRRREESDDDNAPLPVLDEEDWDSEATVVYDADDADDANSVKEEQKISSPKEYQFQVHHARTTPRWIVGEIVKLRQGARHRHFFDYDRLLIVEICGANLKCRPVDRSTCGLHGVARRNVQLATPKEANHVPADDALTGCIYGAKLINEEGMSSFAIDRVPPLNVVVRLSAPGQVEVSVDHCGTVLEGTLVSNDVHLESAGCDDYDPVVRTTLRPVLAEGVPSTLDVRFIWSGAECTVSGGERWWRWSVHGGPGSEAGRVAVAAWRHALGVRTIVDE